MHSMASTPFHIQSIRNSKHASCILLCTIYTQYSAHRTLLLLLSIINETLKAERYYTLPNISDVESLRYDMMLWIRRVSFFQLHMISSYAIISQKCGALTLSCDAAPKKKVSDGRVNKCCVLKISSWEFSSSDCRALMHGVRCIDVVFIPHVWRSLRYSWLLQRIRAGNKISRSNGEHERIYNRCWIDEILPLRGGYENIDEGAY